MKRSQNIILKLFFTISFYFSPIAVFASSVFPLSMSAANQLRALEILGLGTATKVLNNPYPLGGKQGVEAGITSEFISLDDFSHLGKAYNHKSDFQFYTLTLGKGFYNNLDLFLYFTPPVQTEDIQNFGTQMRWGFYQLESFPIIFSLSAYGGGTNFGNLVQVTAKGVDLLGSVVIENMALYFGGGRLQVKGTFVGNLNILDSITESGLTESHLLDEGHLLFGFDINFEKWHLAMQYDRYTDSVYSTKIGFRF